MIKRTSVVGVAFGISVFAVGAALAGDTNDPGVGSGSGVAPSAGAAINARAQVFVHGGASPVADRKKGVKGVTNVGVGDYCIELVGSLNVDKIVPQVTVDWSTSSGSNLSAYVRSSGFGCPAGQLEIYTFTFTAGGNNALSNNVAFFVTVP